MKKFMLVSLLIFTVTTLCICEELKIPTTFDEYGICESFYVFGENGIGHYYKDAGDTDGIEFQYSREIINKLIFFNILSDNLKNERNESVNKILLLTDASGKFYCGFDNNQNGKLLYSSKKDDEWAFDGIKASSELVEKNKTYSVKSLLKFDILDNPWVEGVPGDGIGEYFIIEPQLSSYYENNYLLILNGYISFAKPYLYEYNNRIKKIRVTGLTSNISKEFTLYDTPQPQTIDVSFHANNESLKVEILEVYKGSRYDDTCLSVCRLWYCPLIPAIE